jgi:hypothetical protein
MLALSFFTMLYYPTHLTWWAFIVAILISTAWMVCENLLYYMLD